MRLALHSVPDHGSVTKPAGRRTIGLPPAIAARRLPPPPGWERLDGDLACFKTWKRVRALAPSSWLALPAAPNAGWGRSSAVLQGVTAACLPHPAIALEVERTRIRGVHAESALALMALAALAHARYGGGDQALALADAALEMSAHKACRHAGLVHAMHATLIQPLTAGLGRAAAALAALGQRAALPALGRLYLGGTAFISGMAVPELLHHLESASQPAPAAPDADADLRELEHRASLMRGLLSRDGGALLGELCASDDPVQAGRFGHWLTRLQAAWYAGEQALALGAAKRAAMLAHPLTPAGDLLAYHVFAAMALSRCDDADTLAALHYHCAAARSVDERCRASGGAIAHLMNAAGDYRGGNPLRALAGFERAAAEACRQGLHWLAALAHEQAAWHAAACGLASARSHYRRQALSSHRQWGALGRLHALQACWGHDTESLAPAHPLATPGRPGYDRQTRLGQTIAHELNQPLAAISLHAAAAGKWLRRAEPDVERALESLALINMAGRQAGDIVRGMQDLSAGDAPETGKVSIDQAVREVLQLLRRPLRKHGIEVELALGLGDCSIEANRTQLQQVITNLVVNAIEAHASGSQAGGRRIRIETACSSHDVHVSVSDNGPGIAPEHRERLFTGLFSTKRSNTGTGMGLSISLCIVRAHGGHIWFEACAPQGACFRLRLPRPACQDPRENV